MSLMIYSLISLKNETVDDFVLYTYIVKCSNYTISCTYGSQWRVVMLTNVVQ
jgi:hypothetical protein